MRKVRSIHLIAAVILISVLAEISYYAISFGTRIYLSRALMLMNLLIAFMGMIWTQYRAGWLAYLLLSAVLAVLIGTVTPLSAIGILARLLAPI